MKSFLIVFLFFSGFTSASAQTRSYIIKVVGIKAGEIKVTRSVKADTTFYTLRSQANANFLVYKLKVDYRVKSMFVNNSFVGSEVRVVSNKGNFFTKTEKQGDSFVVVSEQPDKKVNRKIERKIESSSVYMFFHEPKSENKVYAEFYADFIDLKPIKPGVYRGELGKNIDEYYYEKGLMVKTIKKHQITDMVIVYQPE
jgi:hypothetical protein